MPLKHFELAAAALGPVSELPPPRELNIPLAGHQPLAVAGDKIAPGQILATGPYTVHAPLAGEMKEVDSQYMRLAVAEEAGTQEGGPIKGLYGSELVRALAELGAPVSGLSRTDTLVINGVEPEPGVTAHSRILSEHKAELQAGLAVLSEIMQPAETILVVADGTQADLLGNRFAHVPARYPMGLAPLAVKAATGRENPPDAICISVRRLFAVGMAASSGRPPAKAMVSVGGRDFLAPVGTPAGHLLKAAGLTPKAGDKIVLGGAMRGRAAFSPDQGIGLLDYAVTLVKSGTHPPQTGMYCLGCGDCVAVCPARIRPDLISRAGEFGLYERARKWNIDACMECGLCAYVCTGARPVMQYIQLAKKALVEIDRAETAAAGVL